jgi:hypothetical protein
VRIPGATECGVENWEQTLTGMPGDDLARLAVGLANGVDEASVVEPECREVAASRCAD